MLKIIEYAKQSHLFILTWQNIDCLLYHLFWNLHKIVSVLLKSISTKKCKIVFKFLFLLRIIRHIAML